MKERAWLIGTASALAMVLASQTHAQTQPPTPSRASSQANAQQTEPSALEDVVVTAERRSVSVQDIPIAISAFNGEDLGRAGVTDPVTLNKLVSGLDFRSNSGSGLALYIRGVGSYPLNGLAEQANAFSVDGLFFSRPNGPETTFYDLERVEVLKGPQGTLYGRNATAGAVNVITRKPRLGENSLDLQLGAGNYESYQAQAGANLALGDTVAIRAAINVVGHDGYLNDGYNDLETRAGRLHFYWEPSERINLLLTADGAQQRGQGTAYVPVGPNTAEGLPGRFVGDPWDGPSSPSIRAFVQARAATLAPTGRPAPAPPFARRSLTADGAEPNGYVDNDVWGVSGTLNLLFDSFNWTTVAGYRDIRTDNLSYISWDALYSNFESRETTVETRLSSPVSAPFQWIVGAFYGHEDQSNRAWPEAAFYAPANPASMRPIATDDPDYILYNAPDITSTSYAAFAQVTIPLTDTFRFTGGARYTWDKKRLGPGTQGLVDEPFSLTPFPNLVLAPPVPPFFPGVIISGALSPIENRADFEASTFNVGVEYDAAPDRLIYANIRKGYHAGGLVQGDTVGPNPSTFEPETLYAYAIGSKNRFLDNRVQLNLEAYYWDYRDLQIGGIGLVNCRSCTPNPAVPAPQSTLGPTTTNAGRAHTYGLDVEGLFLITDNDLLSVNALFARGEYDEYSTVNQAGVRFSADGARFVNLPSVSMTVGYQHTVDLANGGALVLGGRVRYVGAREFSERPFAGSREGAYTTSDIEVTYSLPGDAVNITAYVRNIEDEAIVASAYNAPEQVTGAEWGVLAPPRTFGVTLTGHF